MEGYNITVEANKANFTNNTKSTGKLQFLEIFGSYAQINGISERICSEIYNNSKDTFFSFKMF